MVVVVLSAKQHPTTTITITTVQHHHHPPTQKKPHNLHDGTGNMAINIESVVVTGDLVMNGGGPVIMARCKIDRSVHDGRRSAFTDSSSMKRKGKEPAVWKDKDSDDDDDDDDGDGLPEAQESKVMVSEEHGWSGVWSNRLWADLVWWW